MEKPKKTEVITFRTDKGIKQYLEEIAKLNQWSVAQVVAAIIQNYSINPNAGQIIVKAKSFFEYVDELKKDNSIEALEINIGLRELEEDEPKIENNPYEKVFYIDIPRSGGLGIEQNNDYLQEMKQNEILDIK